MRRALLGSLVASACLAVPMAVGEDDPLEGHNRKILALNYVVETPPQENGDDAGADPDGG